MSKKIFFALILFAVLWSSYALAMTAQEKATLITEIQEKIKILMAQIAELQNKAKAETETQKESQNQDSASSKEASSQWKGQDWCYDFVENDLYNLFDTSYNDWKTVIKTSPYIDLLWTIFEKEGISVTDSDKETGIYASSAFEKFRVKYIANPSNSRYHPKSKMPANLPKIISILYGCTDSVNTSSSCNSEWTCGDWQKCTTVGENVVRYCIDLNNCANQKNIPSQTRNCSPALVPSSSSSSSSTSSGNNSSVNTNSQTSKASCSKYKIYNGAKCCPAESYSNGTCCSNAHFVSGSVKVGDIIYKGKCESGSGLRPLTLEDIENQIASILKAVANIFGK